MTTEGEHPFDEALRNMPHFELSDSATAEHLRMLASLPEEGTGSTRVPPGNRGEWQSRRTRIAVIGAAAVGLLGAGIGTAAALGAFSSAPPTDRRGAVCFATADLSHPANHFEFGIAVPPGTNPTIGDAARAATDICRGAWQQGRLSGTPPFVSEDPKPAPWNYPVPPLVVCVLKSGQVGVFPGTTETCKALGLPVAEL